MEVHQECQQMMEYLKKVGKNLRPIVVPNGYSDRDLKMLNPSTSPTCCIPNCVKKHDKLLVNFWNIDLEKRLLVLDDYGYVCKFCHACSKLETFLTDASEKLVLHFMKVNELDKDDIHKVQQVYALGYSLKVMLSRMKNLEVVLIQKRSSKKQRGSISRAKRRKKGKQKKKKGGG